MITWRLTNMLPQTQWVNGEIKKVIKKKYPRQTTMKTHHTKSTGAVKVLRGKFTVIQVFTREVSNNLTCR